jgi:hypothetical protein
MFTSKMLRSSEISNTESISFLWWCIIILIGLVILWITRRSSNTIVIYTPKMIPSEAPDIDSIRLDIQFRSQTYETLRERQPILKSQSLPAMHEGSKKTM